MPREPQVGRISAESCPADSDAEESREEEEEWKRSSCASEGVTDEIEQASDKGKEEYGQVWSEEDEVLDDPSTVAREGRLPAHFLGKRILQRIENRSLILQSGNISLDTESAHIKALQQ